MSPKKVQLPKDTTAITVYIKKAKLEEFDKLCGMVARNRMLNKVIDDFIEKEK
jgi:hypothetical protein